MLILTRRVGEAVMVGDEVKVAVLGVDRGRVQIGVDAPQHIQVDRKEIAERKRAERARAG